MNSATIALLLFALSLPALAGKPFQPPTAAQQLAAIGPTNGLSPVLLRAFRPSEQFAPIPAPRAHDWLGAHREAGQTYARFVAAQYNKPDPKRRVIFLQPLGTFRADESPPLDSLREFAAAFFGLETRLLRAQEVDEKAVATRRNRFTKNKQLHAGDIMQVLERRLPPDAFCLLGITMTDLYPEDSWNFVFGMASLRERVGVYSFARYDPAFHGAKRDAGYQQLILRRSCQVLAHETGHMFGLAHCIHFACLMNGSNHLAESDSQPLHLCPVCLRKLHQSVGFDLLERYRQLHGISQKLGLTDAASWYKARLQSLESVPQ